MAKILVSMDTVDEGFERLASENTVIRPPKGRDFTKEEICELIKDCDVLCSVFDMPIDKEIIDKGEKLRLISNYAVGYNNIDIKYAKEKGITVTNTPVSVVIPTAELAFGLIIDCAKRISELDRLMRHHKQGGGLSRIDMMGTDLYGKTIGIVGYGNIGEALAERCNAFGMKVLYYKRNRLSEEVEMKKNIKYFDSLEAMLPLCDIVSVHTPYSKDTHHLINMEKFRLMKQNAIFINTSRGAVVDEKDMVYALKNGIIASAGLDVFENKDVPLQELLDMDNVVMTPHVGTQTYDARVSMVNEMVDNVLGFLNGDDNISVVV